MLARLWATDLHLAACGAHRYCVRWAALNATLNASVSLFSFSDLNVFGSEIVRVFEPLFSQTLVAFLNEDPSIQHKAIHLIDPYIE